MRKIAYTTENFIAKAKEIHGDKYDYSKAVYVNNTTPITIICPIHGEFKQTPKGHLRGYGCKKCGLMNRVNPLKKDTKQFIKEAKSLYGDKYVYSKVNYVNALEKVCIICPEHGEFMATPHDFLRGHSCPECGKIAIGEALKLTQDEFIGRVREIHGDRYDLSLVNYLNYGRKVKVGCQRHGWFETWPQTLLNGGGCPKCGFEKTVEGRKLNSDVFFDRCKRTHDGKYEYDELSFSGVENKIRIKCPKHGWFEQNAKDHSEGHGCPKCGVKISKCESELCEYVKLIVGNEKVVERDRSIIKPYEIDIYIPSMKIGIEYNGLYWHSDAFSDSKHRLLEKTEMCEERGIRLIHVFEDEYLYHKEIVLSKIAHIIGDNQNKKKIMGRKCLISLIDKKDAKIFLEKNHIQGYGFATLYIGAFYNNELVGVMGFKKERKDNNKWELVRFATDNNYTCQGVGGKLFKFFIRNYGCDEIKSFADRRWSTDKAKNIYKQLGFVFDGYTDISYSYISNNSPRMHKFGFRKVALAKKYGVDRNKTEKELTEELGFKKVYDCGLIRYVWKKVIIKKMTP